MHLQIYKNRPNIKAVIYAHPVFVTICTLLGMKLYVRLLTETEETLKTIKQVGYFNSGSLKLAKAVLKASVKHNVIILSHHGIVIMGKDLTEARHHLERLELLAKVSFFTSLKIPDFSQRKQRILKKNLLRDEEYRKRNIRRFVF